tara:strand:- start:6826 stop:7467 length:642 start_codon:yes stop_codon:yes gene_type:complete
MENKKVDIRELVWEEHKNAERQAFVKTLMSGNIDRKLYATYIYNLLQCYSILEQHAHINGLFRSIPDVPRAERLFTDYKALWDDKDNPPTITESTKEYVKHIETIQNDPEKLMAHIYVRHVGDLSGGQMIRRKTPGNNTYLVFQKPEEKKRIIKELIQSYINTYVLNVVAEAKTCFKFATELFKELNELKIFDENNRDTKNDPFKGTSIEGKD